jgi:ketosteroid isomerase-like protein
MKHQELVSLAKEFLNAWNSQDVEKVVACYTEGLVYWDPNTRGQIEGREAMRRYLVKLFAGWKMHWELREVHGFQDEDGAALTWHATFQKPGGGKIVECDGMDLILLQGEQAKRNEVYFDRTILTPLLG